MKMNKEIQKKKLHNELEEQIKSNYYRSRYQNYMSKYNDNKNNNQSSHSPHQINKLQIHNQKSKKKNFKHLLLEKKYFTQANQTISKNIKQQNNNAMKVIKDLQPVVYQQLTSKFPTELENGSFNSIEVFAKINSHFQYNNISNDIINDNYSDNNIDNNIDIKENESQIQRQITNNNKKYSITMLQDQQIRAAIKGNFQTKFQKSPQKLSISNQIYLKKQKSSLQKNIKKQQNHNYIKSNDINNNYHLKHISQEQRINTQSQIRNNSSSKEKKIINNSFHQNNMYEENSQSKRQLISSNHERYRRETFNDLNLQNDSSHWINEQTKTINFQFPELFGTTNYNLSFPAHQVQTQIQTTLNYSNSSKLQDYIPNDLRQNLHDLSTISRFSITSEQGIHIKSYLQTQLNENQYGPYQDTLIKLKNLLQQHPNSRRIYIVGQKMLDDRKQYQLKKQKQTNQINQLKHQISKLKQKIKKAPKININKTIYQNSKQILSLIRRLSKQI